MTVTADDIRSEAAEIFPADSLIYELDQLRTYDCDGLTGRRVVPALVILAGSMQDVQDAVRFCNRLGVPFVARGAGTGLSGGAVSVAEGVVISLQRMNRILEIDFDSERVVVEPGVTNLAVSEAVAEAGLLLNLALQTKLRPKRTWQSHPITKFRVKFGILGAGQTRGGPRDPSHDPGTPKLQLEVGRRKRNTRG